MKKKIGIRAIYDLSATPFFLRGSGYAEGTLFPWVVSDFSLVDAIECGIVKVPRVPVADDSMVDEIPKYRHIWPHVKDALPKKGRKSDDASGAAPELPKELQAALHSLYGNYELYYQEWKAANDESDTGTSLTPPVFIVVCNNTNVSKLVYDWIAGWEQTKTVGDLQITSIVPGQLERFSNVERFTAGENRWTDRPNTILVDSSQIESGEAMSPEFKKIAAREIEEFKNEYRQRFPERDVDAITDEDLLREVMNTVGKAGRLGEQVKCVVSVSMLTEGWDANTVTHVLGIRAFSTQLLCEQVVGTRAAPHDLRDQRGRRPLPGRVRRDLRRAVLVHPGRAGDQQADPAEEGDAGAGARRPRRPRAHLPAPHRLPLRGRRARSSWWSSTSRPACRSPRRTCRR